jgi:hypothetical protein
LSLNERKHQRRNDENRRLGAGESLKPLVESSGMVKTLLAVYKTTGFATRITVTFALGALLGLALGPNAAALQPVGEVFVRLLRMPVVQVVVLTLLAGFSAPSPEGIGRVGLKAECERRRITASPPLAPFKRKGPTRDGTRSYVADR